MAPVRPFDSTRDMLISAIFGRDKVGQTVKDLVIGVERFFTGRGGAGQKRPTMSTGPTPSDIRRWEERERAEMRNAGVDDDISPVFGAGAMASLAMNRSNMAGDREEGASHSEQIATASGRLATSVPFSADDSSVLARQGTQPQQPITDGDQDASQEQVAIAPDSEDAATDDAAQQPETADDEEDSPEQVALASDDEDASTDDAAQQPDAIWHEAAPGTENK